MKKKRNAMMAALSFSVAVNLNGCVYGPPFNPSDNIPQAVYGPPTSEYRAFERNGSSQNNYSNTENTTDTDGENE